MSNYKLPLVLSMLFFSIGIIKLNADDSFSVAWLRKGCTGIVVAENDPKNLTKDQETRNLQILFWLNGFVVGANSMCLANEEKANNSKLTLPPATWIDARKLAPMLLDFLKENPKVQDSAKAREFMTAFYYMKHPDSTERQKAISKSILEKTYK